MTQLPDLKDFGDYGEWPGRAVLDPTGRPLGEVREIYLDDATDRPEWVLVDLGGEGARFVPLADASVEDDAIRVAQPSERIEAAPAFEPSKELTQEEERRLYGHYRLRYSEDDSDSLLPAHDQPSEDGGAGAEEAGAAAGGAAAAAGAAEAAAGGAAAAADTPASPPAAEPASPDAGTSPPTEAPTEALTSEDAGASRPRLRRYQPELPAAGETADAEPEPMTPPRPEPVSPPRQEAQTPPLPPPVTAEDTDTSGDRGMLAKALPIGAGVAAVLALLLIILKRRS